MPDRDRLALIREHVADDPEGLEKVLRGRRFKSVFGGLWQGHKLKRPPAGHAPDAPLIEVIKLKSFLVERERDVRGDGTGVREWIGETFRAMHPFILWLRDAVHPADDDAR
jgi:uncharacterized protein (DUF2461 family)